jgi:hypothetical protein
MLHLGPKGLEEAYQSNPAQFKTDFEAAKLRSSKDPLALAWIYRLELEPQEPQRLDFGSGTLWFTVAMTFAAYFFFRVPEWASWASDASDWFVPYIAPLFLVPLMAYHTMTKNAWVRMRGFWLGVLGLMALNVITDIYWGEWDYARGTWIDNLETERGNLDIPDPFALVRQTQQLFSIHFSLLLWGLLGFLFTKLYVGESRVDFVRHSVQVGLFAFIVSLAGGALLGLTAGLLSLLDSPESFIQNLAIWGLCGLPFFGHYLWVTNKQVLEKILPTLARIFIPLFLLVILIFLVTYVGQGIENLRNNREELFIFNMLLIFVIGLVMMHYAFDEDKHPIITMGVGALVALTLVADGIGLWAIGSRVLEFGLTPNRMTVLFGNLIFAGALGAVLWAILRAKSGEAGPVRSMLNTMLPVFVGWTLVVVLIFPLLYGRYDRAKKALYTKDHPQNFDVSPKKGPAEEASVEDEVSPDGEAERPF